MKFLLIYFYLFKEGIDLLETLSKVSTIIIAASSLVFSIFIYIKSSKKETKKGKEDREKEFENKKIEIFKTILLQNNSNHLLGFFDKLFDVIGELNNADIGNDDDKGALIELIKDEHINYRKKFYDIIFGFNEKAYREIKEITDVLIDGLTEKLFEDTLDLDNFKNYSENKIIECRSKTFKILLSI